MTKTDQNQDFFTPTDEPDFWDISDPSDQAFWEEFFKVEELLDAQDSLDPSPFAITVQNRHTGEVRSYPKVCLSPSKTKIRC